MMKIDLGVEAGYGLKVRYVEPNFILTLHSLTHLAYFYESSTKR